jgi:hypothetical protein
VHHINVAIQQTSAITGSTNGAWFTLSDGATAQCTVVFRSDGAILLVAGISSGTVLATYTGAITASSTWYGFEIEVVVSNTAGSMTVRKNGNPSNDFASPTNLDTAATANNYANRLGIGNSSGSTPQHLDDFLWRSDASVPWAGELRCYTRMPVSDASVQWTPSGAVVPVPNYPGATNGATTLGTTLAQYFPFVAPFSGTISTLSLQCVAGGTASFKCSIYSQAGGAPAAVLGSATIVVNPVAGTTTFTFSTPVTVVQGTTYYVALRGDLNAATWAYHTSPPGSYSYQTNALSYASFPVANPTSLSVSTSAGLQILVNITPTGAVNAPFVADAMQDAAASFVSSSTVGQTDLYGIAPIAGTPASIIGVTTRALAQKSDAGTRNVALRLKSGATDVTGTSTALGTAFGWIWRNDLVDPATGAAWTAVGVSNLQVGQTLSA